MRVLLDLRFSRELELCLRRAKSVGASINHLTERRGMHSPLPFVLLHASLWSISESAEYNKVVIKRVLNSKSSGVIYVDCVHKGTTGARQAATCH